MIHKIATTDDNRLNGSVNGCLAPAVVCVSALRFFFSRQDKTPDLAHRKYNGGLQIFWWSEFDLRALAPGELRAYQLALPCPLIYIWVIVLFIKGKRWT